MTPKKPKANKVIKTETNAGLPVEIIAQEIQDLAEGIKKLRAGKLNDKALVILLHAAIGSQNISKQQITKVLDSLENLEKLYLK